MNKILLLFISFFNLLYENPAYKKESNDFFFVQEEDKNDDGIIYKDNDLSLSFINNEMILKIKDTTYNYLNREVSIQKYNDTIYAFYLDHDILYYDLYNENGSLISEESVISNNNIKSFYIVKHHDDLLTFYSNGVDSWLKIINKNSTYVLSSGHHEKVIDVKNNEDYLYILIRKDKVTEGPFGNGGTNKGLVIAKYDSNYSLIKYITLDDDGEDEFIKIELSLDKLFLITSEDIHTFSLNLDSLNKIDIGNNLLITSGENGLIYVFFPEKIDIYDGHTFLKIDSIELDNPIDEIDLKQDYLLCKINDNKYHADVIDRRELHEYKYLTSDNLELYLNSLNKVYSIFGSLVKVKKEYSEYFKEGSYGSYEATILYKTKGGLSFNIKINENYPLECNIKNNMIYPVGYRIIFNGEGIIDGNVMLSNYQIKEEGSHEIEISGNCKTEKYNIYVNHTQKSLANNTELIIDDFKELKKNEKFFIDYNLGRNVIIKDIKTEGLNFSSFVLKDNILSLNFDGLRNSGYYYFYLDYIDYEEEIDGRTVNLRKYIKDEYWYYIPKNTATISNASYDAYMNYSFNLVDEDNVARLIQFELISARENYLYNYPLGNNQVIFNNIPNGDYLLVASLISDVGRENLDKVKLFSYNVRINSNNSFGEIKTSQDNSKYQKVKIIIDNDFLEESVNEIVFEKDVLFAHEEISVQQIALFSVVGLIGSFIIGTFARHLYLKYKKKDNIY